jgi:hypothetical protein
MNTNLIFDQDQWLDFGILKAILRGSKLELIFHSYDILGARMLWKPKEARILKNF